MMRELLKRFGYRFQLWVAERREASSGAGTPIFRKDESTSQILIRYIGAMTSGVFILMGIGRLIVLFAPKAAFAVFVVLAVLIPFWIFVGVTMLVGEWMAKKAQSAEMPKSSNQTMQRTADRSDV